MKQILTKEWINRELVPRIDSEIAQALDHQKRLTRESEILQAKCEVAGEYRSRLMDFRDRLIRKIESLDDSENVALDSRALDAD